MNAMNTIGIDHNLDRARIRALLAIGHRYDVFELRQRVPVWRTACHNAGREAI